MAGPFGSTLGLGTTGAARGAQNQQVLEQGRYRLAEMQRAEEEAQRSALARQLLLSNLAPLGQVPEGPLFPEQTFTARPDAPIPAAPVAAAPVAAAPAAGLKIAPGFNEPVTNPPSYRFSPLKEPMLGPVSPNATTSKTPARADGGGRGMLSSLSPVPVKTETEKSTFRFYNVPPSPPTDSQIAGQFAKEFTDSANKTAVEKYRAVRDYTKALAESLATPAPGVATPATTAAAATPVVQAVESPITKDPPASSTTSNYLSNPGIIPAELNRATRARNDMVQIANALYSTLQSGSDAYLPQYLDMRAKINQMDSQLFLLGASEGLINLKMGDASLLSNVISAARGVPFQIVDRKDNDNFDVYIGDQLAGANVTFDELEKDARLFVDNAYRSAWAQSMAERDQMLMEAQLKLSSEIKLEEVRSMLKQGEQLQQGEIDMVIEGLKLEGELAKLGRNKTEFTAVNGQDALYFYSKNDPPEIYRVIETDVGKGKNATKVTTLEPVRVNKPLVISGM